jgi:hypothetical protein
LPDGGELVDVDGELSVVHRVRTGDTLASVAAAYLDLTTTYLASELATQIADENRIRRGGALEPGSRLRIGHLLREPFKTGEAARLAPTSDPLRGVYVRGATAGRAMYTSLLDRMFDRGMNAIVLDVKDYDGTLTYPSSVELAVAAGAVKKGHTPMRDFARAVRFAHMRGIRVIARVSCFNDELMSKARPRLAVQSKAGRPYPIGWLDPSNEGAQAYIIDLVKEAISAGADEIQLDYVRYPVLGIRNADFHLAERGLTQTMVIRDFVRRVHAVTQSHGLPLSLDVFGVIAFGHRVDIDALGQDPALLAPECEALSPMVYPSHYSKGFHGWDIPGDHPEIVGIGTKGVLELKGERGAVVRPWLQAMNWNSPTYSPSYLAREIRSADEAGAKGWLMWNPGQAYEIAWAAVPKKRSGDRLAAERERDGRDH